MFINYQDLQTSQGTLHVEWSKLLLEQSTWSTQTRIQHIAQQKLGMEVPVPEKINMVRVAS